MIDMPLNAIPPTTTVANFQRKLAAAENQCWVDVGSGAELSDNAADLVPLVNAGVRGFKCFMIESGVDEFPAPWRMPILCVPCRLCAMKRPLSCSTRKRTALATTTAVPARRQSKSKSADEKQLDPATYDAFLTSRPDDMELAAIRTVIKLSATAPELPLHIVHLASAEALPTIAAAQAAGVPLSVETCFHYLTFAAENIPPRATQYKCCPPIRAAANNEALWDALLRTGEIGTVVSDDSPCIPRSRTREWRLHASRAASLPWALASRSCGPAFKYEPPSSTSAMMAPTRVSFHLPTLRAGSVPTPPNKSVCSPARDQLPWAKMPTSAFLIPMIPSLWISPCSPLRIS